MAYLHFESKAMTNDYDETERPRTPKEAAQAQVAAFRKDMREDGAGREQNNFAILKPPSPGGAGSAQRTWSILSLSINPAR